MLKLTLFSVFLFSFIISSAQSDSVNTISEGKGRHKYARNRLKLTPEQEAKLKEIHHNRKIEVERRKEENRLFSENMQKRTENEVSQVLTPEQQAEYNKMREERKEKMKEKIAKRRAMHNRGRYSGKGIPAVGSTADTTKQ